MKQLKQSVLMIMAAFIVMVFAVGNARAQEKIIKVGITAPLTGPSALWGRDSKTAIETAFNNIHYKIGDYKFELVWIDSQSDPAKASNAFSEAVERKGITVALWDVHSSVSMALMDLTADYKIPLFFPLGASNTIDKKWLSNPKKYSYFGGKGWPEPGKLAIGYVQCLNDAIAKGTWKPKNRKVAIYGEDTDWGRSLGGALKKDFQDTGWKIVSEDYVPLTQVDFYTLLSKYQHDGASVVAGTITPASGMTAFIKQAHEINLKAVIIADGLGWNGDWYKMVGPASNGVLDMIPQLTSPAAKKWAEEIKTQYGFKPSPSAGGQAFDYANFFIKISRYTLKKYGKLDRENYYKVLVNDVDTGKLTYTQKDGAIIMKEYKFTKKSMPDPVVGKDYYYFPVIQYENGKGYIVYPQDWKQRDVVLK